MNKYALIESGVVTNLVVWDGAGAGAWAPPANAQTVRVPADLPVTIGTEYDGKMFVIPEPEPLPEPEPPAVVTARQARLQLLELGKLDAVATTIAALPSPQREQVQIEWEFAAMIERASPLVTLLGKKLKLDLDALFTAAALR